MSKELKPMVKLQRNTEEWFSEWIDLAPLMEEWKRDPSDAVLQEITRSLFRLGLVVDK